MLGVKVKWQSTSCDGGQVLCSRMHVYLAASLYRNTVGRCSALHWTTISSALLITEHTMMIHHSIITIYRSLPLLQHIFNLLYGHALSRLCLEIAVIQFLFGAIVVNSLVCWACPSDQQYQPSGNLWITANWDIDTMEMLFTASIIWSAYKKLSISTSNV